MSTPTVASITGELPEAISKYGRKYGWRHRAHGREFRGTWPRNSSDPKSNSVTEPRIIVVRGPQHRGAALGARYRRARRIKFRGRATKFPSSHPRKFRGGQIRPRNSRELLTPYLQPYSEVASGYSLGNCAWP